MDNILSINAIFYLFCIIYYPFILIYPPLIFKPSTFTFQNFPLYILFHFFIITLAQQNMESRGIKKESPELALYE